MGQQQILTASLGASFACFRGNTRPVERQKTAPGLGVQGRYWKIERLYNQSLSFRVCKKFCVNSKRIVKSAGKKDVELVENIRPVLNGHGPFGFESL